MGISRMAEAPSPPPVRFGGRAGEAIWAEMPPKSPSFPLEAGRQLHRRKAGGGMKPFLDGL